MRTLSPARPQPLPPTSGEEARAFLQERLAFLGLAYALIGMAFFVLGNLAAATLPQYSWRTAAGELVLAANGIYLAQWIVCRRGRLSDVMLRVIDAVSIALVVACNAFMVFSSFPGELPGMSYARMLLLVTFALVFRATAVPSSARRTLVLGIVATFAPVATSYVWFAGLPGAKLPAVLHSTFTGLWCLGAVVISTLASRVIYGLRQQMHEATQLGQYTLLDKIGEGGMGVVYRASHAMLRRPTAVKLLLPEKSGKVQLQRFEREVQLTSRLSHPNTVAIFDYGRTPDGIFYYAMEYLEGLNLEDLVAFDGPQPPARVVHILRQIAGSLAEAHDIGLIHRDIKPANVILVPERGGVPDIAKVVDFGLAKDLDRTAHLPSTHIRRSHPPLQVTQDGWMLGTPHYLSPEAIHSPEAVGPASDLYSLGCVAYFLLTGKTVFEGGSVTEVSAHHLNSSPVPPSVRLGAPLPDSLAALVLRCLEKDPAPRPESARALVMALEACADVPRWTEADARAWWQTREADLALWRLEHRLDVRRTPAVATIVRRAHANRSEAVEEAVV